MSDDEMHTDAEATGEDSGLSAFDDLDPVSTVSALENVQAQAAAPAAPTPIELPLRSSAPPPPLPSRPGVSRPPPLSSPGSLPARSSGVPPLPRAPSSGPPVARAPSNPWSGGAADALGGETSELDFDSLSELSNASAPAMLDDAAGAGEDGDATITAAAPEDPGFDDEKTRVVPDESLERRFDDPHEARTPTYGPNEGAEAAPWDDAELATQHQTPPDINAPAPMHDEGLLELSATTPSTPEAAALDARPALPDQGETPFEDDALTSVMPSSPSMEAGSLPGALPPRPSARPGSLPAAIGIPRPASVPPGSLRPRTLGSIPRISIPPAAAVPREAASSAAAWPASPQHGKTLVWIVAGALALVAAVVAARSLFSAPETGMVTLVTIPADAEVTIDGRPLTGQSSPFSIEGLAAGVSHQVEVAKEGFVAKRTEFDVAAGEVKLLPSIELKATNVQAGFAVDSLPTGATVFVDGEKHGEGTPLRVSDLPPGRHSIRIEHDGYQPWEMHLVLAEGQFVELPQVGLQKGSAPKKVAVAAAKPPSSSSPSAASSSGGPASKSSSRSTSRTASRSTSSKKSATRAVPSAPKAPAVSGKRGTLRVNSRPWSQVYVDGRLYGNTPQLNIEVSAGKHRVELVNPQLGMRKKMTVDVRAGQITTKVVNLVN